MSLKQTQTGNKLSTVVCSTPKYQKKMIPPKSFQSNNNRLDGSVILLHRSIICCSSHNPLISFGLGSDLCLIRHHPTRPQRINFIPELPQQHVETSDTKPRTFILTALNSRPGCPLKASPKGLLSLRPVGARKTHAQKQQQLHLGGILEKKTTVWMK